jgi:hypothetical protein
MNDTCDPGNKPKTLKEFICSARFFKPFLGTVLGAAGGFLLYYFVGCSSGSCALTSNPYLSIIWGGVLGYFLFNGTCSRCS